LRLLTLLVSPFTSRYAALCHSYGPPPTHILGASRHKNALWFLVITPDGAQSYLAEICSLSRTECSALWTDDHKILPNGHRNSWHLEVLTAVRPLLWPWRGQQGTIRGMLLGVQSAWEGCEVWSLGWKT
jgi:hypothetical protein